MHHPKTRCERRFAVRVVKNRALRKLLTSKWPHSSRNVGMAAQTPCSCSCRMCGNPRKWWKAATRKETLHLEALNEHRIL